MTIDDLVRLPWTFNGPQRDAQAGEPFYTITVEELPGFLVTGATPGEAIANVPHALRAFLEDGAKRGSKIKLPVGVRLSTPGTAAPI